MINKDLKVAVLGAGAMGCLFGGLLAEKGLNVNLIDVWKEHVEAINKNGLKMDGHGGDRFIKVKATTDPSTVGIVDAVIVMCKATVLGASFK
jgi:2-dehydropantoate 2-reductase